MDDPSISHAMRTGFAPGQPTENIDCEESRIEFALDMAEEFVEFVLGYDKGILDDFIENRSWAYKAWLN